MLNSNNSGKMAIWKPVSSNIASFQGWMGYSFQVVWFLTNQRHSELRCNQVLTPPTIRPSEKARVFSLEDYLQALSARPEGKDPQFLKIWMSGMLGDPNNLDIEYLKSWDVIQKIGPTFFLQLEHPLNIDNWSASIFYCFKHNSDKLFEVKAKTWLCSPSGSWTLDPFLQFASLRNKMFHHIINKRCVW